MSQPLQSQGNSKLLPAGQMRQPYPQSQAIKHYAFCRKHQQPITVFCMAHNMPLCPACIKDCAIEAAQKSQKSQMFNAPSDQMPNQHGPSGNNANQTSMCNIRNLEAAIKESITVMHNSLKSVQDFIKKKDVTIDMFSEERMCQLYKEQNHVFEHSYNVAHDFLTRIQAMTYGEKVLHLSSFNSHFQEQFAQMKKTMQFMDQIIVQIQNTNSQKYQMNTGTGQMGQDVRRGNQPVDLLGNGQTSGGGYYHTGQDMGPIDFDTPQHMDNFKQQQQQQLLRQQQAHPIAAQQISQQQMQQQQHQHQDYFMQSQQAKNHQGQMNQVPQQKHQQQMYQQQAFDQQLQQQNQSQTLQSTQHAQSVQANQSKIGEGTQGGGMFSHMQGGVQSMQQQQSQVNQQQQQMGHMNYNQVQSTNQENQVMDQYQGHMDDASRQNADYMNKQRKTQEQSHSSGMQSNSFNNQQHQQQPTQQSSSYPSVQKQNPEVSVSAHLENKQESDHFVAMSVQQAQMAKQAAQKQQQSSRPQKPSSAAYPSPPLVPGYNNTFQRGIQLFVTVEIEDQYLKNNLNQGQQSQQSGEQQRYPSAKQIEFEIDLDPAWNLQQFSSKVKEDIKRSQLAVNDNRVIENLKIYHANRIVGGQGQPVHHTYFSLLTNMTEPFKTLGIQPGTQIIFTTISKTHSQNQQSPSARTGASGFGPDRGGKFNQISSPRGQGMGQAGDKMHGFPGGFNKENGKGSSASHKFHKQDSLKDGKGKKGPQAKASKQQLDEDGIPLKKKVSIRKTKVVEEITLKFRLVDIGELTENQQEQFYPSADASDNEDANKEQQDKPEEDENKEEEVKGEEDAEADAPVAQTETQKKPKEKVFDREIRVQPKTRLKGIRKAILEQLGVQDICTARIFSCTKPVKKPEPDQEEKRDEDKPEAPAEGENAPAEEPEKPEKAPEGDDDADFREPLIGEMATLDTLGLSDGANLEVEVFFKIEVSVPGKGSSYITKIEVSPDEALGVLESRVSFFNMFKQRGFQIFAPDLDRVIEFNELPKLLFRDSQLKNDSKLVLLEPPRKKIGPDGEELSEFESEQESEQEEGGEEEMEEMEDDVEEQKSDGEAAEEQEKEEDDKMDEGQEEREAEEKDEEKEDAEVEEKEGVEGEEVAAEGEEEVGDQ